MFDDRLPPFQAHGGILEHFDDGHVPETFRCTDNDNDDDDEMNVPRIVRYPLHHAESPPSVRVYDDALPTRLLDQLYRCTTAVHPGDASPKPWGTYVTIREAVEWMDRFDDGNADVLNVKCESQTMGEHRHDLAVAAVSLLLFGHNDPPSATVPSDAASDPPKLLHQLSTNRSTALESDAHGVAVWALSSNVGSEVRYHIDYAEQYRYERNITVPPLLAGTVQCTNFATSSDDENNDNAGDTDGMVGGDFAVNLGGLGHYEANGYKGARSGDDRGGWTDPFVGAKSSSFRSSAPHHDERTDWVTVPYRYNRAIFHHGQLPHLSTPIQSISTSSSDASGPSKKLRVILGMNVFGHDIGQEVSRAPEHSDAFRRKIKMYRALLSKPCTNGDGYERSLAQYNSKISVEAVKKNKALSKLLVLAKREKVKQDLRERQGRLTESIFEALQKASSVEASPITVGELMDSLGQSNTDDGANWPTPTDVHVHLHHLIAVNEPSKPNERRIVLAEDEDRVGKDGLVLSSVKLSLEQVQNNTA